MVDLDGTLTEYRDQLLRLLYDKNCYCERVGEQVHRLAQFIISRSTETLESRLEWFDSAVRGEFLVYSTSLVEERSTERKPWEDMARKLADYSLRYHSICDHIRQIDSGIGHPFSESLDFFVKHQMVRSLVEEKQELLRCFKLACKYYLFESEDCSSQINLIYRSVKDFTEATELSGVCESTFNDSVFEDLTNAILECFKEYLLAGHHFSAIYKAWVRLLALYDSIGHYDGHVSGLKLLFDENPSHLMKSLEGVLLSHDDVDALLYLRSDDQWFLELEDAYIKYREVKFSDDFERLFRSILLLNYGYHGIVEYPSVYEPRKEFIKDVEDVPRFHTALINFMDLSFKRNYNMIRKTTEDLPNDTQRLWAKAASILLELYIPDPQVFLKRYVKESLIPQLLMLNAKFPSYYNHKNCVQRLWIETIRNDSLMGVEPYFAVIYDVLRSVKPDQTVHGSRIKLATLYISERVSSRVFADRNNDDIPIWPSLLLKNQWDEEVQRFAKENKTLKGLFSLHTITMKSPFRLQSGQRLDILTNLATASIINLFNDFEDLKVSDVCRLLNTDQTETIVSSLAKLEQCGIVKQEKANFYTINKHYEAPDLVAKSGVIRCI
ncbi:hypothetical protein HG537_0A06930 [Torulaspora globosa]|uniref:Cullin family profile domain-containing protein n=1 Tax=Torulaspora globosa TaxID=48254 RepID=A0A7H9HMC7_9SACH|nr:hypothetical protein HG537_0A06930 [Torulaspora sp. CBS 2947]